MAAKKVVGGKTRKSPWQLATPGGKAAFEAFRDAALDPPALVIRSGKTELRYQLRCIDDLCAMLKRHGDWMPLGGADEQKPAAEGTVEAWARSTRTRSAAGTASRRACAADSRSTSRRSWRFSALPRSRTTRATTACGRFEMG